MRKNYRRVKFQKPKSSIHLIVRGLLLQGNNVILCSVKDGKWFFLPGGHIEDGESVKMALMRELREEIGQNNYNITSFVGACENIFPLKQGVFQHEMNIIFAVDVPEDIELKTKEDHIEFISVGKDDLKNYKILPTILKDGIIEWLYSHNPFFKEIET